MTKKTHYTEQTHTLNAVYLAPFNNEKTNTTVKADYIHQGLFAARQGFDAQITQQPNICAKTNKDIITSANLLTIGLGILYSDTPESEGSLDTLLFKSTPIPEPIILETPVLWNAQAFFKKDTNLHHPKIAKNKSLRNTEFQTMLTTHVKLYDIHATQPLYQEHHDPVIYYENPQYHERFHHSEQSLLAYLYRKDQGQLFIKKLLKTLKPTYVSGIILDLYSDRKVCPNCAVGLSGCQCSHDQNGFLFEIEDMLKTLHIEHPIKPFLSTRISSESTSQTTIIMDPPKNPSFLKINPEKNPSFVFEKLNQTYQQKILEENPLFKNPSMIFSSRKFKPPTKMQNIVTEWKTPTTFITN